jgi:HJR/Mrr/RecB family endonuclease
LNWTLPLLARVLARRVRDLPVAAKELSDVTANLEIIDLFAALGQETRNREQAQARLLDAFAEKGDREFAKFLALARKAGWEAATRNIGGANP